MFSHSSMIQSSVQKPDEWLILSPDGSIQTMCDLFDTCHQSIHLCLLSTTLPCDLCPPMEKAASPMSLLSTSPSPQSRWRYISSAMARRHQICGTSQRAIGRPPFLVWHLSWWKWNERGLLCTNATPNQTLWQDNRLSWSHQKRSPSTYQSLFEWRLAVPPRLYFLFHSYRSDVISVINWWRQKSSEEHSFKGTLKDL